MKKVFWMVLLLTLFCSLNTAFAETVELECECKDFLGHKTGETDYFTVTINKNNETAYIKSNAGNHRDMGWDASVKYSPNEIMVQSRSWFGFIINRSDLTLNSHGSKGSCKIMKKKKTLI